MNNKLKTASLCVQGGYKAGNGEPIELPIIQSTTFKYDTSDQMADLFDLKADGYFYTRPRVHRTAVIYVVKPVESQRLQRSSARQRRYQ